MDHLKTLLLVACFQVAIICFSTLNLYETKRYEWFYLLVINVLLASINIFNIINLKQ